MSKSVYNREQTAYICRKYEEDPTDETISTLAKEFRRSRKSIIAKLTREGLYSAQGYLDKTGEPPITKLELQSRIESLLNENLHDLNKAPKQSLKRLYRSVDQLDTDLEAITLEWESLREDNERMREQLNHLLRQRGDRRDKLK